MSKVIVKNKTTGKELVWRSVKVKKSLDEICHTLELELPPGERLKVRKHDRLTVNCDNPLIKNSGGTGLITTVLVDEVTASADTLKHIVTVAGRSPARDIIDSTWSDTDSDTDRTLRKIAQQIGNKFNIACDTFPPDSVDPTKIVHAFCWENESPWTKLIGESDNQGYIFTSNQAGGLYLWKVAPGVRHEPFHITEGKNVENIRWTENGSEQFHEYVVKGGDSEVRVIDDTCRGNRILTIDIDDPFISEDKLQRRAITEMKRRKENKTTITVPGWGLTNEQIISLGSTYKKELFWFPNSIIPVRIPSLGLNANLLISEVEFTVASDDMSCNITLVNKEAYL